MLKVILAFLVLIPLHLVAETPKRPTANDDSQGPAGGPPKEKRLEFKAPPRSIVYDAAFSLDGKLLAVGCLDDEIVIYDAATGAEQMVLNSKMGRVWSIAFSPDGTKLVSGCGPWSKVEEPGEVRVWDLKTGKDIATFKDQKGAICQVAFTPDGKSIISASWDSTVIFRDAVTGMQKTVLKDHTGPVRTFAFSKDGKIFATGSFDGSVIFWDPVTLKKQKTIPAHTHGVQCIAFSPSSRMFATVERPTNPTGKSGVKIWDTATARELLQVPGIAVPLCSVEFSADERMLAIGGGARAKSSEVKLIEVVSGKPRAELVGHKEWVEFVRFSPDNRFLLTGGGFTHKVPGEMRVWYLADLWPIKGGALTAKEAEGLWNDLAAQDANAAYKAILSLAAAPATTLALLKDRVRPPAKVDFKTVLPLIADLDNDSFAVREKATAALAAMGEQIEPVLLKALQDSPSAEVRVRLKLVLAGIGSASQALLQQYRAIEVLDRIGSPEAAAILQKLAKGSPDTRLTQEAQRTWKRIVGQE